jgi:hypothetical protein
MKPDRHSGGNRPVLALCPGKSEVQGMKTARSTCISRIWRPCEPSQQSEQNLSHFLWTSVKDESKVCDVPESNSFTQGEQPIRIAC